MRATWLAGWSVVWATVADELPAGIRAIDPNPRIHPLGLPARSALLDPPVSVDHHVMARRREESG